MIPTVGMDARRDACTPMPSCHRLFQLLRFAASKGLLIAFSTSAAVLC